MNKVAADNIRETLLVLDEIVTMADDGYGGEETVRAVGDDEQFYRILTKAKVAKVLLNTVLLDVEGTSDGDEAVGSVERNRADHAEGNARPDDEPAPDHAG